MSFHDLYLHNRKPYSPTLYSTTAREFVPDPIFNKKKEFVPLELEQIGRSTGIRTRIDRLKADYSSL